ncbi:tetratricopeptide repeat protein [Luteimonas yindakuii]|uniref:winged helix-turn-helix domain-containing tetratricopeptide repeat protein n=1 Tax=Luteimonas yindakuii TaxID=2565782 RepID=UPI0011076BDE|nr:winged helix-turn-helix domain-containing protein [Luteimonas yindakuii]QCO67455.2 tetratricopeptide repeat protein [Luteimonas yindakuii]
MPDEHAAGGAGHGPERYRFGDCVVDVPAHVLERGGEPLTLEPKAFAVLVHLLRHAGELVLRDALLDAVWGHRHVTPGVLARAIAQLRHVLGDDFHHPHCIQTQHGLGYRFIAVVEVDDAASGPEGDRPEEHPPQPPRTAPAPRSRWAGWWPWLAAVGLLVALGWWSQRAPAPRAASVAVLPFANLGSNREDDYFAEGLAVEMHDALAGVPGLTVAALMSPGALDGERDPRALGERLGVAAVLDASVRRDGRRVRISARLADTATGYTLWSRHYDRVLDDIFATQGEIAQDVASALVTVMPDTGRRLEQRLAPTRNVAAFDIYLRGLQHLRRSGGEEDAQAAISLFRQALGEDAGLAAAELGICRSELWRFSSARDASALGRAQAACVAAQRLAPEWRRVDLLLGDIHRQRGEPDAARARYARAAQDPGLLAEVHLRQGLLHDADGNTDAAMAEYRRARAMRPGDASIIARIGYREFLAGRTGPAIQAYREAVALRPEDENLWSSLAGMYLNAGRHREAADAFNRSLAIRPGKEAYLNYGILMFQSGDYPRAAELMQRALEFDHEDFWVWGALADALRADPVTAAQSAARYEQARSLAIAYLALKPDDAKAQAALGWYEAALGHHQAARQRALEAERLGGEPGEVAAINAQTFSLAGSTAEVATRVAAATAAGVPAQRFASNPFVDAGVGAGVDSTTPGASGRNKGEPHAQVH